MSGGSLDYLYLKVEEAAERIIMRYGQLGASPDDRTRYSATAAAFAQHLMLVAKALKEMEWEMSGDGSDWSTIKKLIGPKQEAAAVAKDLQDLLLVGQNVLERLQRESK